MSFSDANGEKISHKFTKQLEFKVKILNLFSPKKTAIQWEVISLCSLLWAKERAEKSPEKPDLNE